MKMTLITLASRPPAWATDACDDLLKRFPRDWSPQVIELKPENRSGRSIEQLLALERDRIMAQIPKGAKLIVLDERGTDLNSQSLARKLGQWHDSSEQLCLVIGSADGLHVDVKQAASEQWRLSSLTLPHALAKVLLIEAMYRAWSILAGHPYHRE